MDIIGDILYIRNGFSEGIRALSDLCGIALFESANTIRAVQLVISFFIIYPIPWSR